MRVAYLLPRCVPEYGHGRYVIELVRRLADRVSVDIFSSAFGSGLPAGVGCHFLPVPNRPAVARLAVLWAGSALMPIAGRFDVVHTLGADAPIGNVVTALYCNAAEAERRRLRAAVGSTSDTRRSFNNAVGALAERHCLTKRGTRRVIAVSRAMKAEIIRHYRVDPSRIAVVYCGVDLERFNPRHRVRWRDEVRRQMGLSPTSFVVLFLGGDYPRKGLLTLMRAVHATHRRDIELLVVGPEPGPEVVACAAELGLDDRVKFVKPTPETSGYYAAADAFALPTQYDTFSLATLEAMASGLPVIVSGDAGIVEIITNKVDGMVLPQHWDVEALALHLVLLSDDRDLRARLGERGRHTAEQYSWDRTAQQTLEIYEEVAHAAGSQHLTRTVPTRPVDS